MPPATHESTQLLHLFSTPWHANGPLDCLPWHPESQGQCALGNPWAPVGPFFIWALPQTPKDSASKVIPILPSSGRWGRPFNSHCGSPSGWPYSCHLTSPPPPSFPGQHTSPLHFITSQVMDFSSDNWNSDAVLTLPLSTLPRAVYTNKRINSHPAQSVGTFTLQRETCHP